MDLNLKSSFANLAVHKPFVVVVEVVAVADEVEFVVVALAAVEDILGWAVHSY